MSSGQRFDITLTAVDMKTSLVLLLIAAAALPARTAPARTAPALRSGVSPVDGPSELQVTDKGREKKSYTAARGDAVAPCAGQYASAGLALGHGGLGGLGLHAPLLAPQIPVGGYYGLRPYGYGASLGSGYQTLGVGHGSLGAGAAGHYRGQDMQLDASENQNQVTKTSSSSLRSAVGSDTSELSSTAQARSAYGLGYGGGYSAGFSGGQVGLFPGAIGGCGGIPLLISCTPSLVTGQILSGGYGGHGGLYGGHGGLYGGHSGLYRTAGDAVSDIQLKEQPLPKGPQPVPPTAPPASPASPAAPATIAHSKTSSSQAFHSSSSSLHRLPAPASASA